MDAMILGKGVFGIFSTVEKAQVFKDQFEASTAFGCQVRRISVIGGCGSPKSILAAHSYEQIYDSHIFEGLYAEVLLARDAVGEKGLIVEFVIDAPQSKQVR